MTVLPCRALMRKSADVKSTHVGTVHVSPHLCSAELHLEADKTKVICGERVQMDWTRLGGGRETGRL